MGPAQPLIAVDNSFEESKDETAIFPFLSSQNHDSTKFTHANSNPTLAPVSNLHERPLRL